MNQVKSQENEKKVFNVVILKKNRKKPKASYSIPFVDAFDAITWGEKQATEFGEKHYAELR